MFLLLVPGAKLNSNNKYQSSGATTKFEKAIKESLMNIGRAVGNKATRVTVQHIDSMFNRVCRASRLFYKNSRDTPVTKNSRLSFVNNLYSTIVNTSSESLGLLAVRASKNVSLTKEQYVKFAYDYMSIGVMTTQAVFNYSRQPGFRVANKLLYDTERDAQDPAIRRILTSTTGFNQKTFDVFLDKSFNTIKDYKFMLRDHQGIYRQEITKDKTSTVNFYANIINESFQLTIKAENTIYSTLAKIHVCQIKTPETTVRDICEKVFWPQLSVSEKFFNENAINKIPFNNQYSDPELENDIKCSVRTDIDCSLNQSRFWRESVRVLRTFKRNLGPADKWTFNLTHHLGSGIRLDKLYRPKFCQSHESIDIAPLGFFVVVEYTGDPRSSVTAMDTSDTFDGTSPCLVNYTFHKRVCYVAEEFTDKFTVRSYRNNEQDFMDEESLEYFGHGSRRQRVNVNFSDVNVNPNEAKGGTHVLRYGEARLRTYKKSEYTISMSEDFWDNDGKNESKSPRYRSYENEDRFNKSDPIDVDTSTNSWDDEDD